MRHTRTALLTTLVLLGALLSGCGADGPAGVTPSTESLIGEEVTTGPDAELPSQWPSDFPLPAQYRVAAGVTTPEVHSAILVSELPYSDVVAFYDAELAAPYRVANREQGTSGTRWTLADGGLVEVFDAGSDDVTRTDVGIELPR